jgi:hypothetical protein
MPDLALHFENIQVELSILAINLIICLLCTGLNQEVSDRIWDLMFLKGHKMIFRFILAIFNMLKPKLMEIDRFDLAMQAIDDMPKFI